MGTQHVVINLEGKLRLLCDSDTPIKMLNNTLEGHISTFAKEATPGYYLLLRTREPEKHDGPEIYTKILSVEFGEFIKLF